MTITLEEILKYNQEVPRYTSYPTAPVWGAVDAKLYRFHLERAQGPFSLYFHIPFCKSMCLYCGCSVILNRKKETESQYVSYLLQEISLVGSIVGRQPVKQIHFGGGTPTQLDTAHFERIFAALNRYFEVDYGSEVAIEIDPRTVYADQGEKLSALKQLGFNRVSFGVQDLDPAVQEAVKRRQSEEMTKATYAKARSLGFHSINMDLIYGLPYQTVASFERTLQEIIALAPDRIALFSYAKVPWIKPHQKAIREEWLPATEEKFKIYLMARQLFQEAGYISLGLDHFFKPTDELAKGVIQRNFQGYTLKLAEHSLPFGITAVGDVSRGYFQNVKELEHYYRCLDARQLPIAKGHILSDDDLLRRWTIHTLMCTLSLNKESFHTQFGYPFDVYFSLELENVKQSIDPELFINSPQTFQIVGKGALFIRNIVSSFDSYYQNKSTRYSRAI